MLVPRRVWLGRDRELAELVTGLDALSAGRGGLYLITGEPGIGKTRLGDELLSVAAARGLRTHRGYAWETGGAPSYWPLVSVLRSVNRGLDPALRRHLLETHGVALAELLPELRRELAPSDPASAARDRFQLFDAVSDLLRCAAESTAQVILLDDLHAFDPSSLQLLQLLVRELAGAPVLLVGTYREADARRDPEIGSVLARLAREATVLPLARLSREEVARLVEAAAGAPSREQVEALYQRSEGNPLFLREILRITDPGARLPDTVRELLRARLPSPGTEGRAALEVASVLGREFRADLVAATLGRGQASLTPWLRAAEEAGVLEVVGAETWRFTHVLLREAAYDEIETDRRAALHLAAAQAIRRRGGAVPLSEVAHHALLAVPALPLEEAARAATVAAEHAMALLAFEDAAALLTRALSQLESVEVAEAVRFEVLLGLGVARIRSGERVRGGELCLRAAALARRLGDGVLLARAALGATRDYAAGERDRGLIALLEEALGALPPGDSALRARCMAQLAAERQPEPDTGPLVQLALDAVAMARRSGDVEVVRLTVSDAVMATMLYADLGVRQALDQELLRLAQATGDRLLTIRARLTLTVDALERGERAEVLLHFRAYNALIVGLPAPRLEAMNREMEASLALWDGRFDEARRLHRAAMDLLATEGVDGEGPAVMAAFPMGILRAAERDEDSGELEARLRADLGAAQQELGLCVAELLIAQLHGRARRRDRVVAQLAILEANPVFALLREPVWLAMLSDAVHLLGDTAMAARLLPLLAPRAASFRHLGPTGGYLDPPFSRDLGLLALTLGRVDEAVAHLREAERRVAQAGLRSHLARTRMELAGALRRRGEAEDRAAATTLLCQARELAEELGQQALLPWIAELQGRIDPPRLVPTTGRPTFSLRREGEIWSLSQGSRVLRLRDGRGLQVLDQLLRHPGQEFHVLQLAAAGEGLADAGDAGAHLDATAINRYRNRLIDLREDLEEAEDRGDLGRATRAQAEIEALTAELARAVGLGGAERRAASAAERARTAVQKRLRSAIERIGAELPELGLHLEQTVRTGVFCGYFPEGGRWTRARRG